MQLPKDLEPTLTKFHKEAKNPTKYLLSDYRRTYGVFF